MADSADGFAARITQLIDEIGHGELAGRSGIATRTLYDYSRGVSEPKRPQLIALAAAARVNLYWLATGEGPKEGEPNSDFDPALMRECIEALEDIARADGREISAQRKAEIMVEFYVQEHQLKERGQRGPLGQIAVRLIRFLKAS